MLYDKDDALHVEFRVYTDLLDCSADSRLFENCLFKQYSP